MFERTSVCVCMHGRLPWLFFQSERVLLSFSRSFFFLVTLCLPFLVILSLQFVCYLQDSMRNYNKESRVALWESHDRKDSFFSDSVVSTEKAG